MTRFLAVTVIVTGGMLATGCATKKFVRQTAAPIQAKVDQVGEQAAKQGQEIQETRANVKEVDERAQTGISAAQERASTADKNAGEAMGRANQANELAGRANEQAGRNAEALNGLRQEIGRASCRETE